MFVESPEKFPPTDKISESYEPMVKATIITPPEYLGEMIQLLHERRGQQLALEYLSDTRIHLKYRIPLGEVISDFFDSLKKCSSGYASFDYEEDGYARIELAKVCDCEKERERE
jgi:translation elongation factor EF-4